jgi:L,D-transpeptidase YcbB
VRAAGREHHIIWEIGTNDDNQSTELHHGRGAMAASAWAGTAHAQNVLDEIFGSTRRGAWNDQFDAKVGGGSTVGGTLVTNQPIMSPETVFYVEQAIAHYSNLAAQGGWPMVPARKRLQIGVVDPDVQALRRRLMISGDLSERAGISDAFDTYVDAAVKRFQGRHGLPADGVTGNTPTPR